MTDGWDGILDDDEAILWQGRPDGALTFDTGNIFALIFGLFFAGFALFWMIMASQAGGVFWMFGLLHFFVGLAVAIGPTFYSAFRRRHTWYTLTNRRAFIATDMPIRGRSLGSYPITRSTSMSLQEGPLDTLWFASTAKRTKNGTRTVKIGFERIEQGRDVLRMMRDIQEGRATKEAAHE
ncbi:aspartate carbamoyltransferase catalytic subunit [Shimia sediminis]|uniref:aspartate carbamoyltransferase catalytic subunit n=1 Tax=Shimia sediminis TaxID=2497945 RepID=UPI001F19533B|nr:aspartate carbamoyltransferase catalytic subunit [Shimia sediminis]